ncbi:MAG: leucine-rich repeat domain-containing protein [Clostridia bacterium]|nr:leucine-rich repeat domain-containing protein [Clostridia bacterium]
MSDFIIENGTLIKYAGKSKRVEIPKDVAVIGSEAFRFCRNLQTVVIPESVTEIGDSAFSDCENLRNVAIPESTQKIGGCAFWGCEGPQNITISNNVTEIGYGAFFHCKSLKSISVPAKVTKIEEGTFNWCENLENAVIPEGVVKIDKEAFHWCQNLQAVIIPESVTIVENRAFDGCESLRKIVIPQKIAKIGEYAFYGCPNISYIYAGENITSMINNKNMQKTCATVVTHSENGIGFVAYCSKANSDNFTDFLENNNWNAYDIELINNGPTYKYKPTVRLLGALGRLNDPVELTDECKELYVELLVKNAKKLIPIAEEIDCPEIVEMMIKHEIINDGNRKAINKLLKASANEKIAAFAE